MLKRPPFIGAFAALGLAWFGASTAPAQTPAATAIDPVNDLVGTQAIGSSYQFTTKSKLVEAAQGIHEMGSNIIKFALGPHYADWGDAVDADVSGEKFHSVTELARDEPSIRQVLDMPFANYLIWTYCFSTGKLNQNLSQEQLGNEYREIYDFTRYLLTTYNGTGKTFYLGHWEGDWMLLNWSGFAKEDKKETPTPKAIAAMIAWLNTRQKAVDDAKRDTPHAGVDVYHYSEVNLVTLKAMQGGTTVLNDVIPHTDVDYVSYSSYDSIHQKDIAGTLTAALNYIVSKLPPKPGVPGQRAFVGEYGFQARAYTPEEQDLKSRQVILAALKWGAPFVLYWEYYNNETDEKGQIGYWLIDNKNVKQPIYYTFQKYHTAARDFISAFEKDNGRAPLDAEFRAFAIKWFSNSPTNEEEQPKP